MTIDDLKHCCRCLNSEKVTERKKAAEQLKSLLNNDAVVATLSYLSKLQNENNFNWNQVFHSSTNFFLKETEKLERDQRNKENPSSAVLSNWENSKRIAASLPKLVLKKSCQDIPYVRVSLITDFVFTVLSRDRPYLLEHYAGDALQIILKYIMGYSQYYDQISQEKWKDLLRISIWIFENNVKNLDLISIISVIEKIVIIFRESKCSSPNVLSPSVALRPLASFLERCFNTAVIQRHHGLQGALVSLILATCIQYGFQWRFLLCKIGEVVFDDILQLWENKPTSKQINILRFFNLQLIMHDPQLDGEYKECNHFSDDSNSWKRNLKQLYLVIFDNLTEISQMSRVSSNYPIKENLPNELITLIARLFAQLFGEFEESASFDITQNGSSSSMSSSFSQVSKRRRVEIGFRYLCDWIREDAGQEVSMTWYLILISMMKNHRNFFTKCDRAQTLLQLLFYTLTKSKRSIVIEENLRCLIQLASCRLFTEEDLYFEESKKQWTKISELTIRLISGKQCSSIGTQLLSVLISSKLICPQNSLYKLFTEEVLVFDECSLKLMEVLLLHCPLPKRIKRDDLSGGENEIDPRLHLINLLLPLQVLPENGNEDSFVLPVHFTSEVARVLSLLMVQSPAKVKMKEVKRENLNRPNNEMKYEEELERLYLKSFSELNFSLPPEKKCTDLDFSDSIALSPVQEAVIQRTDMFIKKCLLQVDNNNIQKGDIFMILNITFMLVHIWSYFKNERFLRMIPKLDIPTKYVNELLNPSSDSSSQSSELISVVNHLTSLNLTVLRIYSFQDENRCLLKHMYDAFPSNFQDTLLHTIKERKIPCDTNAQYPTISQSGLSFRNRSHNQAANLTFDPDFDDELDSDPSLVIVKDDFEEDTNFLTELSSEKGPGREFSRISLSSKDEGVLTMTECLARMYEMITLIDPSSDEEELPFIECFKTFSQFLQSNRYEDQIMVLEFIFLVFKMNYNEDNVEDALVMLSKISGNISSDARVVSYALRAIKELLITSGKKMVDEHRNNIVHLLKTFGEKYKKGNYGQRVPELIHDCIIHLVELDPLRRWSNFTTNNDNRLSQIYGLMKSPYHDSRMKVVDSVSLLFENLGQPLHLHFQKKNFEEIYQIAIESLTVEGNISGEFILDEGTSRVASFLGILVGVAASSSALEHQAIYAIISSIKVNGIKLNVAKRFLQSDISKKATLNSFMKSHLQYIVAQWIKDKHPLEEFPYQIFEEPDFETFAHDYCPQIVSGLFILEEGIQALEKLSQMLDYNLKIIVEQNFASLVASIFPSLVVSASECEDEYKLSRKKIAQAKSKWKAIENVLGSDLLRSHIGNDIGEIVLNLFRLAHHPNAWHEGEVIISPSHLYFDVSVILYTVNYFHNLFFKDQDNLMSLLCNRKSPIQSILHGLFADFAEALSIKSRRLRLYLVPFETFVRAVIPAIGSNLHSMEYFLIRKIVFILTNFIVDLTSENVGLALRCSFIFDDFICACLSYEASTQILITTLPSIVPRLYILHSNDTVAASIYQTLVKLFESEMKPLKVALSNVPLFLDISNNEKLQMVQNYHNNLIKKYQRNTCLRRRVETFIHTPTIDVTCYDIQNIAHLLTEKNLEINELYSSYMPDGSVTAHSLIQKIVSVMSSTMDEKIGQAGLECLGKLGPVDLNSSVFLIEESIGAEIQKLENRETKMVANILISLNRMTFSSDLAVVDSSVMALRQILSQRSYYVILFEMENEDLFRDLLPFIPNRKPKTGIRLYEDLPLIEYETKIGKDCLWEPESDFSSWLKRVTISLIEAGCGTDLFNSLLPVCNVDTNFCKLLLPYTVLYSLKTDLKRRQCLSKIISDLVSKLFQSLSSGKKYKRVDSSARQCLRMIVHVINFLRCEDPGISFSERKYVTKWDQNMWLDVNYLVLAKAAFHCDCLYSAVLFSEIACDILQEPPTKEGIKKSLKISTECRPLPPLHRIANLPSGKEISTLLLKVSNELGDSEGVEGCTGVGTVTDGLLQSSLSHHRGHHAQALYISDALNDQQDLIRGLQSVGMYNTMYRMSFSPTKTANEDFLEAQAECAWRLGKWDADIMESDSRLDFNQLFLRALKSLKEKDYNSVKELKRIFFTNSLSSLRESGNESTSNIYPLLTNLQIFSELTDVSKCLVVQSRDEIASLILSMELNWKEKENFGSLEKGFKERIIGARVAFTKILNSILEDEKNIFEDLLFSLLVMKCDLGNISERFTALQEVKSLKISPEKKWTLTLEEIKFSLSLDNNSQAIFSLERLIEDLNTDTSESAEKIKVFYSALLLYGNVLRKSKTKSPKHIIENCYGKAIKLISESSNEASYEFLEEGYHNLASFGDKLYQEVSNILSSDQLQNRLKQVERSKSELNQMHNLSKLTKKGTTLASKNSEIINIRKRIMFLNRDISREMKEFECLKSEAEEYLSLSLENYFRVLCYSSKYDLDIFRIIALWLENPTSIKANQLVDMYNCKVKSHKYIPLMYQLVARLSLTEDPKKQHSHFNTILSSILGRVCYGHPHHGLPVVLMLANAHLDDEVGKTSSSVKGQKSNMDSYIEEDRVKAAKAFVGSLKKESKLREHIAELESVFTAYVTLANKEDKKSICKMNSSNSNLMKLRDLSFVAPLTRQIPVQPSEEYSTPLLAGWDSSVQVLGGINKPLKLSVFSSDGIRSFEILKGNDDLRQDAVLEQVFCVVNELLRKDKEAKKNKLSVRTYLVVPLSQETGLIQWCDNTATLSEYLEKAQKRYYPDDYKFQTARGILIDTIKECEGNDSQRKKEDALIRTFEDILRNLHPVLHYFFYEEYPLPEKWFVHRRAYTCSVATSSVVGYIIGLGDRHVQNILLDLRAAEVIHIDLGIAFENGKILNTPERVPFRMTQNVVDGLGAMGVEGPLRKNMETTMRILREAKSLLITIVEVLRHDPLHHWTISPAQAQKLQQRESREITFADNSTSASMAERALIRLQQKLNGLEDGFVLSVPEHVGVVIQQAMDVKSLSQMFPGWQPYL